MTKLTKKRLKELINDESMAHAEYSELYEDEDNKISKTINGIKTNFESMSNDENRHKEFLLSLLSLRNDKQNKK